MTVPQAPPFDAGNSLLAETPALLTTSLLDTPSGQRLAVTVRTPSTTLTVLLNGADAKTWGDHLSAQAAPMSRSGLVVASGGALPRPPNGQVTGP